MKNTSVRKNQLNVFLCLQGTTFSISVICPWSGGGLQKPSSSSNSLTMLSQILCCCKPTDTTKRRLWSGWGTRLHITVCTHFLMLDLLVFAINKPPSTHPQHCTFREKEKEGNNNNLHKIHIP